MAQAQTSSNSGSLRALGVVSSAHLAASFCIIGVAPLVPLFQPELKISKVEVGLMFSLMYFGVVVGSIPGGYLADRLKARPVMVLANVILGAFVFLVGTATSYPAALVFLMMVGLGYSALNPVTTKAVVAWFDSRRRATAMSIKQMGVTAGGMLAAMLLPSIAVFLGWRIALQIAAVVAVATAVVTWFVYQEARDVEVAPQVAGRQSGIRDVLFDRQILLLGAVAAIFGMAQVTVSSYLVLFLNEAHFLPAVVAGFGLAAAQASGMIGRIGGGVASDVFFHGARRKALIWIGVIVVGSTAITAVLPYGMSLWVLVPIAALLGVSALGWNGVGMTLAGEASDRTMVGRSSGVVVGFSFLGSVVWSPIFGYIVDSTGSFGYGWGSVAAVMLVGVFLLRFAVRERAARQSLVEGDGR